MDSKKRHLRSGPSPEHVKNVYKQVSEIKEQQAQIIQRDSGRGHHTNSTRAAKQSG